MDFKKTASDRIMKLMQNPKVMEVLMNPRVMNTISAVMSARGKVSSAVDAAAASFARSLKLATREDVRDLRKKVRQLEEELEQTRAALDERDEDR